jgi:hypothetical protein
MVETGTPMQKVIPSHLVEPYLNGQRSVIAGFVYRTQDSSFRDPAEFFTALDLGYEGSDFAPDIAELYLLRWLARDMDTYLIPYSPARGGDWHDKLPFAGNGFTSSRVHNVAEFYTEPMPIPVGTAMHRITAAAGDELVAWYDGMAWRRAAKES